MIQLEFDNMPLVYGTGNIAAGGTHHGSGNAVVFPIAGKTEPFPSTAGDEMGFLFTGDHIVGNTLPDLSRCHHGNCLLFQNLQCQRIG